MLEMRTGSEVERLGTPQDDVSVTPDSGVRAANSSAIAGGTTNRTELPPRQESETDIGYVHRVRRMQLDGAKRVDEWASRLTWSKAQLNRAVDAGAVRFGLRETGRQHVVRVVDADDLLTFLCTVDAVQRTLICPPAWCRSLRVTRASLSAPRPIPARLPRAVPPARVWTSNRSTT